MISSLVEGLSGSWEVVIGLEVHAKIDSESKLFSGAPAGVCNLPNTQVSFVDGGFPGMLPVLNRKCIEHAVRTGIALNGVINLVSRFDRKHYFYPDLPAGYQITQFYQPIVQDGHLDICLSNEENKPVRINRLHLEVDAGKSIHDRYASLSLIDLNRSGIGLMEIVTEPDLRSSEEVAIFLRKLRQLLRYIGSCDGNMEDGSLRCDCNVSVRRPGAALGTRCEIKNLNSVRFAVQAIEYEAQRQIDVLEAGGTVRQETLLFDPHCRRTRPMRGKEDRHDYRYFPEPDLPAVVLDRDWVAEVRANLHELPDQKIERYIRDFSLSAYEAKQLVSDKSVANFFERVSDRHNPRFSAQWITRDLFGLLNKRKQPFELCPIDADEFSGLLDRVTNHALSVSLAKLVLAEMIDTGKSVELIMANGNISQLNDLVTIRDAVDSVISDHPKVVNEYRIGKKKLLGFLIGQVMKATNGKADPALVNDEISFRLGEKSVDVDS